MVDTCTRTQFWLVCIRKVQCLSGVWTDKEVDACLLGFIRKCSSLVFFLITLAQFVVNCLSAVDFIAPGRKWHP
jgi:hypothetical protein